MERMTQRPEHTSAADAEVKHYSRPSRQVLPCSRKELAKQRLFTAAAFWVVGKLLDQRKGKNKKITAKSSQKNEWK